MCLSVRSSATDFHILPSPWPGLDFPGVISPQKLRGDPRNAAVEDSIREKLSPKKNCPCALSDLC